MSFLKSLDNFLDSLFFPERIRQMDKINHLRSLNETMRAELEKRGVIVVPPSEKLDKYEKEWMEAERKNPPQLMKKKLNIAYLSKEKQKALADRLARECASRIFSPEHNVFSDSWQYYRVGFCEGFIKALELVGKGDVE